MESKPKIIIVKRPKPKVERESVSDEVKEAYGVNKLSGLAQKDKLDSLNQVLSDMKSMKDISTSLYNSLNGTSPVLDYPIIQSLTILMRNVMDRYVEDDGILEDIKPIQESQVRSAAGGDSPAVQPSVQPSVRPEMPTKEEPIKPPPDERLPKPAFVAPIEIKQSNIPGAGIGAFLTKPVKKGEEIGQKYDGVFMSEADFRNKYGNDFTSTYKVKGGYLVGKEMPYLAKNLSHYINEGKPRNVYLKRGFLVASRDLPAGTELLLKYFKDYDRPWMKKK